MKLTKLDLALLVGVGFMIGFALSAKAEPAEYRIHTRWSIPTTRANGAALAVSELAGYEIYWTCDGGKSSGAVSVPGGATDHADFAGPWIGSCFFAMAAIDTAGAKSALSPTVPLTFKPNKPAEGGFD